MEQELVCVPPEMCGLDDTHRNIYTISNGDWRPFKLGPKTRLENIRYDWIEGKLYGVDANAELVETTISLSGGDRVRAASWKKASDGSIVDENESWPNDPGRIRELTQIHHSPKLYS